jgi:hypothetical protein
MQNKVFSKAQVAAIVSRYFSLKHYTEYMQMHAVFYVTFNTGRSATGRANPVVEQSVRTQSKTLNRKIMYPVHRAATVGRRRFLL